MWSNFFRDGGFGMYPTALFGFLLVASAVALILRPGRKYLLVAGALTVATIASGLLGTATGLINTLRFAAANPDDAGAIPIGCAESLNCTVLALILTTLASLFAIIAAMRAARSATAAG